MDMQALRELVVKILETEAMSNRSTRRDKWSEGTTLQCLGAGCYGAAFLMQDGRVLKIGKSIDGTSRWIFDGTSRWICDAAKHMRDTGKPGDCMPEVYLYGLQQWDQPSARGFGKDRYYVKTLGTAWFAIMERVTVACTKWPDEIEDAFYAAKHKCEQAAARWAVFHNIDAGWDVHSGNFGHTRKGRVVVFDPFCHSEDVSTLSDVSMGLRKFKPSAPQHKFLRSRTWWDARALAHQPVRI